MCENINIAEVSEELKLKIKPNKSLYIFILSVFVIIPMSAGILGFVFALIDRSSTLAVQSTIVISATPFVFFMIYLLLRLFTFTYYVCDREGISKYKRLRRRNNGFVWQYKWDDIENFTYWCLTYTSLMSPNGYLKVSFNAKDVENKQNIYMTKKQALKIKELFYPDLHIETYKN